MIKAAIVVLADTETHEALGRVVNALETAKEMKDEGEDVTIVFDGAGTKWVPELSDKNHKVHPLFEAVNDKIEGVCHYCAGAFGVRHKIEKLDIPLLSEYDEHPSLLRLIREGYQIITFCVLWKTEISISLS